MSNPLSSPDASIILSCGLGHHSLHQPATIHGSCPTPLAARSLPLSTPPACPLSLAPAKHLSPHCPTHHPPRRPGHCAFLSRLSRPHRPAAWGRWNFTRETFPAKYGWRAIFGEGPNNIFHLPHRNRRATFREPAVPGTAFPGCFSGVLLIPPDTPACPHVGRVALSYALSDYAEPSRRSLLPRPQKHAFVTT